MRKRIVEAELRRAVVESKSIAAVLRSLGLKVGGANYRTINRYLTTLALDISHWTGQGHRRGSITPVRKPCVLAQVLVKGSRVNSDRLRRRLLREGVLDAFCASCGLRKWFDRPIPLELDHIDGDSENNELLNLRLLCPNCHALTPTYRGRNIGRRLKDEKPVVLELAVG
jgi:hypothetical protein